MKIYTNTKTLDKFIPEYTDNPEEAEWLILGSRKIDDISQFKNLKGIFRVGVGTDNIPETSVPVCFPSEQTKSIIYEEVASFTCNLIFKGVYNQVGTVTPWSKNDRDSMSSKNILVVGSEGNIGRRVVSRMVPHALVTEYDVHVETPLEEMVREADVVTLHVPLIEATKNLIKPEWLKENVVLVNTARGGLVEEEKLWQFLSINREAQAFFDVFWKEPYDGPLLSLENFNAYPHVSSTCNQFFEGLYKDFLDFTEGK